MWEGRCCKRNAAQRVGRLPESSSDTNQQKFSLSRNVRIRSGLGVQNYPLVDSPITILLNRQKRAATHQRRGSIGGTHARKAQASEFHVRILATCYQGDPGISNSGKREGETRSIDGVCSVM